MVLIGNAQSRWVCSADSYHTIASNLLQESGNETEESENKTFRNSLSSSSFKTEIVSADCLFFHLN